MLPISGWFGLWYDVFCLSSDAATVVALRVPRLATSTRIESDLYDLVVEKARAAAQGLEAAAFASMTSSHHSDAPARIMRAALRPAASKTRGNRDRLLRDKAGNKP